MTYDFKFFGPEREEKETVRGLTEAQVICLETMCERENLVYLVKEVENDEP